MAIEIKDWLNIAAILTAPVVAVQVQKWIERYRESKSRKVDIFKTLMTTRATMVSLEHVQALNMIDVEFNRRKYHNIVNAWRAYHDHLTNDRPQNAGWGEKNDKLFIDLLFIMVKSLGYSFDKVMLKRTAYTPVAHGDIEFEQQTIRQGMTKIFSGESAFPVFFVNNLSQDKKK